MAKYGSASAWLFVSGYDLRAMKLKSLTDKRESLTEADHGLGDSAEEHRPIGVVRTTLTQGGGFYDDAATSSHAALNGGLPSGPSSTPRVVCFGVEGQTAGQEFTGCAGEYSHTYEVLAEREGLTKANAEYRVAGVHERGRILQALAAQTQDWDTESASIDHTTDPHRRPVAITSNSQTSPSVVTTPVPHGLTTGDVVVISGVSGSNADINGERTVTVVTPTTFSVAVNAGTSGGTGGQFVRASSRNGGAGYLQVTACTGFTNFVAKIRDSADDSTFADLVTFADNVSAPFAERVTVSGVVDRYLAVDGDVTGSGSITAFVGFARA